MIRVFELLAVRVDVRVRDDLHIEIDDSEDREDILDALGHFGFDNLLDLRLGRRRALGIARGVGDGPGEPLGQRVGEPVAHDRENQVVVDAVLPEVVFHRHVEQVVDLADARPVSEILLPVSPLTQRREIGRLGAFQRLNVLIGPADDLDCLLVVGQVVVEVVGDLFGVGRERVLVFLESALVVPVEVDEVLSPVDLGRVQSDFVDQRVGVELVVESALPEVLTTVLL